MRILAAEEAYKLVQEGNIAEVLAANVSNHFLWEEVFRNCSRQDIQRAWKTIYLNAQFHAINTMDKIRDHFNKPVRIHRWYSTPAHNAAVGGKRHSFHLVALAADFDVDGDTSVSGCRKIQDELNHLPFMQKCGLEFTGGGWTHADSRGWPARFYG